MGWVQKQPLRKYLFKFILFFKGHLNVLLISPMSVVVRDMTHGMVVTCLLGLSSHGPCGCLSHGLKDVRHTTRGKIVTWNGRHIKWKAKLSSGNLSFQSNVIKTIFSPALTFKEPSASGFLSTLVSRRNASSRGHRRRGRGKSHRPLFLHSPDNLMFSGYTGEARGNSRDLFNWETEGLLPYNRQN